MISYDLHKEKIENIMTEYEEKFSKQGIKIKYVKAIKKASSLSFGLRMRIFFTSFLLSHILINRRISMKKTRNTFFTDKKDKRI